MRIAKRMIVETNYPYSRVFPKPVGGRADPDDLVLDLDPQILALEYLFDQFLDSDDTFRFLDDKPELDPGIELKLPIQEFVMQGLHYLDEWPRINKMYGSDNAKLRATEDTNLVGLTEIQRALLSWARQGSTLSEVRMGLGLSRPALLRRVEELRTLGRITVEGTPSGGDLIAKLIGQATILLREKQYDEAAHVFSALLAADPTVTQVKKLFREAEKKHIESLYQTMPPAAVVVLRDPNAINSQRLTQSDREVVARINGRWDVSVLVLASPLREVETLKTLQKLLALHLVELRIRVIKQRSTRPRGSRPKRKSSTKIAVPNLKTSSAPKQKKGR
jgi:DNA-binding Lrp family transcriptional regulator